MSLFNKTVLEQVARDGVTYKSLAKEMAQALLGQLPTTTDLPTEMRILLSSDNYESERLAKDDPCLPLYEFVAETLHSGATGNHYVVYNLKRRTV